MQLPEGSILLIVVWGFVIFLLWNFYRFSQTLRKTAFVVIVGLASATLVGGIVYLQFHKPKQLPESRPSILIFPFIEKSDRAAGMINAAGLAVADMIGERLQRATNAPFYIIPTDALFAVANNDSLAYIDYALHLAKLARLQIIGFGTFKATASRMPNHRESWSADIQLFDLRQTLTHAEMRLKLPEQLNDLQDIAAEAAAAIFQMYSRNGEITLTATWQDQLSADLLQRYYSAKFSLLMDQTESALEQAQALRQADSSRAQFAGLYVRAVMAHLRRKTMSQKEWNDSLQIILPLAQRAATQDSLHSESARRLGEIYIRLKKWNDAERALVEARRREPTDSQIYPLLAHLHASRLPPLGFQNELELYRRARALNPLNIEAGLAEADYFWRQNREKPAVEILERLLQLNPNHLEALMSLGRIYITKNNEAKIFEIYQRILKLAPDNAEAYYNLGIVYYHRKDFDNAIKFFERAIKLNNHAEARLYLAGIYERRGEVERAIQYLRERIRLSRGDDDVYAAEARRQLYKILSARGEIPAHLLPDTLKKP
jgi:cytochrome c-type biogenesis protein CcmH/NrfG